MDVFANHHGYARTFQKDNLTLGLIFPIESYKGNMPVMNVEQQVKRAKMAEKSNFAALFVRDIPLNEPAFGDVGQMYDPWVFLSHIAAHTKDIALGTASAITSFQPALTIAKSAASLDKISRNRLLFGLATGDRTIEFDAFDVEYEKRAEIYRETFSIMKKMWSTDFPTIQTDRVHLTGETDLLPKPTLRDIPTFVTGFSGQSLEWIASHGDGWISYPRNPVLQEKFINDYRALIGGFKPFAQSLYVDLSEDPNEAPTFMRLGFKSGSMYLREYLQGLKDIGVNHVILSSKESDRPADEIMQQLAEEVVPYFPAL